MPGATADDCRDAGGRAVPGATAEEAPGAAACSARADAGAGVLIPADATGVCSLGSARLAVPPESPRGRTVAVQSLPDASDAALATPGPAVPVDWPPRAATLRSATGATPPPAQATVINAAASTTNNARYTRILFSITRTFTPLRNINRVAPPRRRRAFRRNDRAAAASRARRGNARHRDTPPRW